MKNKSLEDELFLLGWILFVICGIILVFLFSFLSFDLPQIPCFLLKYFGIYCPGCGGTRAILALLQGHFIQSIWYHPLILYCLIVGGGFMLTHTLHRIGITKIKGWKYHNWYLNGMILIVVCNFLIKNLLKFIWGITI